MRLKDPTDPDFAKRVKPRNPEAARAARARAYDHLYARARPEESGVLNRRPCAPERETVPRQGYEPQSSHIPGVKRLDRARKLLKDMDGNFDAGTTAEMVNKDFLAQGLWKSMQRARKRAAEEMGATDVSAEAAQGASGSAGDDWQASSGWEQSWWGKESCWQASSGWEQKKIRGGAANGRAGAPRSSETERARAGCKALAYRLGVGMPCRIPQQSASHRLPRKLSDKHRCRLRSSHPIPQPTSM